MNLCDVLRVASSFRVSDAVLPFFIAKFFTLIGVVTKLNIDAFIDSSLEMLRIISPSKPAVQTVTQSIHYTYAVLHLLIKLHTPEIVLILSILITLMLQEDVHAIHTL